MCVRSARIFFVMTPRTFTRLALLFPLLGILLATLFVSVPASRSHAQRPVYCQALQVPDRETCVEQSYVDARETGPIVHRARRFSSRPRALPLVTNLHTPIQIPVREARHTGRYVLRHSGAYNEVVASSQYGYLFRLTPF